MQILGKAIRNVHSWDFAAVDVLANDRLAPEAALGGLEIQLPLYPRKLTQLRNRGMSEMCATNGHSINLIC
jgi:hypothetical protein